MTIVSLNHDAAVPRDLYLPMKDAPGMNIKIYILALASLQRAPTLMCLPGNRFAPLGRRKPTKWRNQP
jgi:hypothetical protein